MVPVGEESELSFLLGLLHCSDALAGAVCNESERGRLAWWWPVTRNVSYESCNLGWRLT